MDFTAVGESVPAKYAPSSQPSPPSGEERAAANGDSPIPISTLVASSPFPQDFSSPIVGKGGWCSLPRGLHKK